MDKLLVELDKALDATEDFNKFKHLFSDDDAERTLAELRQTVCKIKGLYKMSHIKEVGFPDGVPIKINGNSGSFVSIRPCAEEYGDKTYLGMYIGEIATSSIVNIKDDKLVCSWSSYNPAIFVFDLSRVIFGYESWWGEIESEEDLRKITDIDIENVWYVKVLKTMSEEQDNER